MSSLSRYWRAQKLGAVRAGKARESGSQLASLPPEEQERIRKQHAEYAAKRRGK